MGITFYEETHEYLDDNGVSIPSVTTILKAISSPSYSEVAQATLEYARQRGSAVHESLECYDYGMDFENIPTVTPEIHGYLQAYLKFLNDYRPKWKYIEAIVQDKLYGYCGTVDRAGEINGKFAVLDIKTNASPTAENKVCVCCQTSAYSVALGKPNAKRYALYLKKDGKYTLFDCEKFEDERDFNSWGMFNTCLTLHKQLEEVKGKSRRKKNG